jgi:hypothetical protein
MRGGTVSTRGVAWRAAQRPRDIARDELPPARANLALIAPGTDWADCSERGQRRETRKLRRSDRGEGSWPMRAFHWATSPTDIASICLSAGSAAVHLFPAEGP